jgi:hypothetical protein
MRKTRLICVYQREELEDGFFIIELLFIDAVIAIEDLFHRHLKVRGALAMD